MSLVLVAVLFAPAVLAGDNYELSDSLAFLAVPLLLAGAGVGALVGVRPAAPIEGRASRSGARMRRPLVMVAAGSAVVLAAWTTAWAMGLVDAPPLGIG
ncbi:MAG: hypothetical protein ACTHOD_13630 [Motilibacteraceae bacterium]